VIRKKLVKDAPNGFLEAESGKCRNGQAHEPLVRNVEQYQRVQAHKSSKEYAVDA
jgi:hypothetical protein